MTRATQERELRRVTSRGNALIKELRRGFAQGTPGEEGLVAIEGVRMVEEALRSGVRLHAIVFREPAEKTAERLLAQVSAKAEAIAVPAEVFESAVLTESPQGVAALIEAKRFALEDALRGAEPMVLALAGVQDPGNVGTLLRSAEAFGAAGVLLLEGTVSAWNPKAVRAAAGSIFRLPAVKTKFEEALPKLREQGVKLVAGSSHKGKPLTREALLGAVCIVIGNEGAGVPRAVMDEVDEVVLIPHSPKVESLNAAVAGAVMMYEGRRLS